MRAHQKAYRHVEELQLEFQSRKDDIRKRLDEFARVKPEDYYYELAYCLLTPQSSATNAARAIEALKAIDFIGSDVEPTIILNQRSHYIRFHNTKARHLLEAKRRFAEIAAKLAQSTAPIELRAWLVENVKGLGWKEASHFLRNIGYRDLAILDRHILKNLKQHNVLRAVPKALTPKRYRAIEMKFAAFAKQVGITMDELDLLFWSRETGEILK